MCIGSPRGGAVRAHSNFFLCYESARRASDLSAGGLWARTPWDTPWNRWFITVCDMNIDVNRWACLTPPCLYPSHPPSQRPIIDRPPEREGSCCRLPPPPPPCSSSSSLLVLVFLTMVSTRLASARSAMLSARAPPRWPRSTLSARPRVDWTPSVSAARTTRSSACSTAPHPLVGPVGRWGVGEGGCAREGEESGHRARARAYEREGEENCEWVAGRSGARGVRAHPSCIFFRLVHAGRTMRTQRTAGCRPRGREAALGKELKCAARFEPIAT